MCSSLPQRRAVRMLTPLRQMCLCKRNQLFKLSHCLISACFSCWDSRGREGDALQRVLSTCSVYKVLINPHQGKDPTVNNYCITSSGGDSVTHTYNNSNNGLLLIRDHADYVHTLLINWWFHLLKWDTRERAITFPHCDASKCACLLSTNSQWLEQWKV